MAQGNVEFTKKVTYQIGKTDYSDVVLDEYEKIEVAQHILNAQINGPDVITDTEMPPLMLGADLDWGVGIVDDLLVGIAGNSRLSIVQDLDDENVQHIEYKDRFKFNVIGDEGGLVFTFPSNSSYVADFYIDWGDGTSSDITSWDDPELTHEYFGASGWTVEVKGICEYLYFNDAGMIYELGECYNAETIKTVSFQNSSIISIPSSWGKLNLLTTASSMFKYCSNLETIPSGLFDNSPNINSFFQTWRDCSSLTAIPDGLFNNNPNVSSFYGTFYSCSLITSIPTDLFKYNTLVQTFGPTFHDTSITSIPVDLFKYCTLAQYFQYTFSSTLITSIPKGIFDYNTEVKSFNSVFRYCYSLTQLPVKDDEVSLNGESLYGTELFMSSENNDIPAKVNMFDYNIKVTNFTGTFSSTGITSIPTGLFDYNTAAYEFSSTFDGCDSITAIPAKLFDNCSPNGYFYQTFYYCDNLESIPAGLFDSMTQTTSFRRTFQGCPLITEIPAGLFDYCTEVTVFDSTFQACDTLATIPAGLFDYNIKVTQMTEVFYSTAITSIPVDLFRHNTLITNFKSVFANCDLLTSIPEDLFRYNTIAEDFSGIFYTADLIDTIPVGIFDYNTLALTFDTAFAFTAVTEIPAGLFNNCTVATNFNDTFNSINILEVPVDLFRYNVLAESFENTFRLNVFLYKVPNNLFQYNTAVITFDDTFNNCSSLNGSVTETGELYDWMQSHNPAVTTGCFYGCTTIQDWDLIPSTWGGGGLAALTNNITINVADSGTVAWDFTLPINDILNVGMDVVVDWGDAGPTDHITDYTDVAATHNYPDNITYTITITGKLSWMDFSYSSPLKNVGVTSKDMGFKYISFRNSDLITIDASFGNNKQIINWANMFDECFDLTTIPLGTINARYSNGNYSNMLSNTWSLTSIPAGLLDNCYNATNIVGIFEGSAITTIPTGLFDNMPEVTSLDRLFYSSNNLTAIPIGLFDKLINVTSAEFTFWHTFDVASLPTDLFRYNTLITSFRECFQSSTTITTIPADFFRYNILAEDFYKVFNSAWEIINLPADLFLYNTAITIIEFGFKGCNLLVTAVTGVNDLIDQVETNNASVTKTGCFDGCTSITDYASIPIGASDWRTV